MHRAADAVQVRVSTLENRDSHLHDLLHLRLRAVQVSKSRTAQVSLRY